MLNDYDWSWSRERFKDALERYRRWLEKWLLALQAQVLPIACMLVVAVVGYYGVQAALWNQPKVQQTSGVSYGLAGDWQTAKEIAKSVESQGAEAIKPPCTGSIVQDYGFVYSKRYGDYRYHNSITYKPSDGAVTAALSGTVTEIKAGEKGRVVCLEHKGKLSTQYIGLGTVTVKENQTVAQGESLGMTADDLDFTVLVGQQSVDPKKFLGE